MSAPDEQPLTSEEIAKIRQLLSHFSLPSAIIRLDSSAPPSVLPPVYWLATMSWLCTFGLLLAMVFDVARVDGVTIFGFVFCCLVDLIAAYAASSSAATKKPGGA